MVTNEYTAPTTCRGEASCLEILIYGHGMLNWGCSLLFSSPKSYQEFLDLSTLILFSTFKANLCRQANPKKCISLSTMQPHTSVLNVITAVITCGNWSKPISHVLSIHLYQQILYLHNVNKRQNVEWHACIWLNN